MTPEQIEYLASLREAGGHTTMPVPLSEWREWMATKSIGRATVKDGKVKPVASMPLHRKIAATKKADRTEKRLRANRKGAA